MGAHRPPPEPARPERPQLRAPRDMPKRRGGGTLNNRIALLHALAHIELNAIDLAWDLIARFIAPLPEAMRSSFADDWVGVADDEARHFGLLAARLESLGKAYGDLPAHAGLWQAAETTSDDLLARLAVVPLVLEARGLDVTPAMHQRLENAGDSASADIPETVYNDEIGHVATGERWFTRICGLRGLDRRKTFQDLVRARFRAPLKAPFNEAARRRAGLDPLDYRPLAQEL